MNAGCFNDVQQGPTAHRVNRIDVPQNLESYRQNTQSKSTISSSGLDDDEVYLPI